MTDNGSTLGTGLEALFDAGPGPWASAGRGMRARQPVVQDLEQVVAGQGGVSLWLRLDAPIANGPGVEAGGEDVVLLPGLGKLNLWWYSGYAGINFEFESKPNGIVGTEVPGLPGPQWIHLAFTWDASSGRFQGYLNGTPIRVPGTRFPPWDAGRTERILVHASRWAIADLRVYGRWVEGEEVRAMVPPVYRGALDHTVGAQPLGSFDPSPQRGELLLRVPLAQPEDTACWRMEGPGAVSFRDGWMELRSMTPQASGPDGHIVYWCDRDLPADFLLEFDCRIRSAYGLNIVFFCAKGRKGEDVLDPTLGSRTGVFGHYTMGDINCYHVSYFAEAASAPGRVTSNLRKNHGFYLVDNGPLGIPPGSNGVHRVAILKQGGWIRIGVDGRLLIDWFDDGAHYGPVLGAGKFALRQMRWSVAEYRDLVVHAVKPMDAPLLKYSGKGIPCHD